MIPVRRRIAFDVPVQLVGMLTVDTAEARALRRALAENVLLLSGETLDQLMQALSDPDLDPYCSFEERHELLEGLGRIVELVEGRTVIEVAAAGSAARIVTDQERYLAMRSFAGIAITSPEAFAAG